MLDARWTELVGRIKDTFPVEREFSEPIDHGTADGIIFEGPMGRMKLERTQRAAIVGEKATGSNRIGSDVAIQNVYDEDTQIENIRLYREMDGEWLAVDINAAAMLG